MASDEIAKEQASAPASDGALDLGLGSLLEPAAEVPEVRAAASEAEPVPSEAGAPTILDSLRLHAARSEWREIVSLCEAQPAHGEDALLVRAWWLKAQLALQDLPLAVLIAPLDSLSDAVEREKLSADSSKKAELLAIVLPLMDTVIDRLAVDGELDYAIALLERLGRISPAPAKTSAALVGRIRSRVQAGDHLRRSRLDAIAPDRGPLDQAAAPVTAGAVSAIPDPQLSVASVTRPPKPRSRRVFVVAGLAIVAVTALIVKHFALENSPGDGRPPTLRIDYVAELVPVLPTPIMAVRQLDTLMQDMARARTDLRTTAPEKPITRVSEESASSEVEPGNPPATPRRAEQPARPALVQLDTRSPIEPPEVREALSRPPAREPNIMDLAQPAGRRRADNPQVTGPGVYRVIARTDVLSRPTYRSYRVAVLVPGDKIQVDEDMGSWLRLKSRNGRPGYILAQDAVRDSSR